MAETPPIIKNILRSRREANTPTELHAEEISTYVWLLTTLFITEDSTSHSSSSPTEVSDMRVS